MQVERLKIGDNFNPEIGFVRRDDMRARLRPLQVQPAAATAAARSASTSTTAPIEYIENGAGRLESRERALEFALEFQSADRFSVNYTNSFEFLPVPSLIGSVVLPVGEYTFDTFRVGYNLEPAAPRLGQPDGGVRHLLQRSQDDAQRGARASADHQSAVGGADLFVQSRHARCRASSRRTWPARA